ncbi:MAG: Hsp20 family protein [Pseudomonadota bacterium]
MTSGRLTLFDSPLFLGFDHLEETFQRMRKSAGDGYPPYNIEQTGEKTLRITLAVAGFTMDDLDVEIDQTQLTIRGQQTDDENRVYLHRGIAARQFQRAFVLADGMEVKGAAIDNGLLHIDLEQVVPEKSARKVEIKNANGDTKNAQAIDVESTDISSD